MLDRNKIKSFAWSSDTFHNGVEDYNNHRAELDSINIDDDGDIAVRAQVTGDHGKIYGCAFILSKESNTVLGADCTCPARCDAFGYCRHVCAAMLRYMDVSLITGTKEPFKKRSSPAVASLIASYNEMAEEEAEFSAPSEKVRLVPELEIHMGKMELSAKIGKTRMYVIKNINGFIEDVQNNTVKRYGKELEIRHSREIFDEESRALLDYLSIITAAPAQSTFRYYYNSNNRTVRLSGSRTDKFFDTLTSNQISINGKPGKISYDDAPVILDIEKSSKDIYTLTAETECTLVGLTKHAYFYNEYKNILYICSERFTSAVGKLITAMSHSGMELTINEKDMPAFYSSVIVPVKKYLHIEGMDNIEKYIPPEAEIRLYLDSPDPDTVYARLEYTYGADTYPAFINTADKKLCDMKAEKTAERAVLKYFAVNDSDDRHPLIITGDDNIYRLFSEGISELTGIMEIYASDRFNNMKVRPPIRPTIGIRPESGGLLALDIETDGYTMRELADMLSSYRKGQKYHRLKDGSFIDLKDNGIEDFAQLTEGLNISDKALLKQNINIPQYRMLYLDSLQERSGGMKIRKSMEFRSIARAFSEISSSDFKVPDELDGLMREYQKYGFKWLKTISAYGFGGILADDMGLGKTLQAISLMLSVKQENDKKGEHCINLVVCPSSLTLNWESELRRFAPSLKSQVIIGAASVRAELIKNSTDCDVLITSYSMLTRDILEYEDISFYLQFIDEAQFIKNHNTQASKAVKGINSAVRFALTGTPVENSLAELWSIYDYIMPDYLFGYSHFKKTFETPIVKEKSERAVSSLQKITSPFILRRLKKDVLTELPDKTEITLTSDMTEEQKKLYTANVLSMKKNLREKYFKGNPNDGRIEILAMLTRLRQICCDPSLVYENYTSGSAKLEQCMELIESCIVSGHKILLFSQFTSMLDIISKKLKEEGISFYTLTGATKAEERLRLVNCFNKDDTQVFMISLKAGGTGLNLTGADIVIHYDPWWNVSAENQATDRAHRIGQRNNVSVYKLISKNTIEEKIQELQKNKKALADMAVNGEGDIMKMSPADIMNILD